jgi:hypothetical protein
MIVNDELGRIWKEAIMGCLRNFLSICLRRLRKTTETSVRTTGFGPRIKNEESVSPLVPFRISNFMLLLIICIIHISVAERSYVIHSFLGRCMIRKVRRSQIFESSMNCLEHSIEGWVGCG